MDSLRHLDLIFRNNSVFEKAIQLVTINCNRRLIVVVNKLGLELCQAQVWLEVEVKLKSV